MKKIYFGVTKLKTLLTYFNKKVHKHTRAHAHKVCTPQSQSIGLIQTESWNRGNVQICTNTHWRLWIT